MPKTKAQKKPKPSARLSGGHQLLRQSLRLLKFNRRLMVQVVLVVVIVNWIISFASSGATASLYQGVWFGFASCALIWAIRHHQVKKASLGQAFWVGTAPALKFFVVVSLIGLISLPFSIGSFIFSTINYLAAGTSPVALAIAAAVWLLLGVLSLLLLARLVPALVIVTLPEVRPLAAIRASWRLARGRTLVVAARLLVMFGYVILALLLISLGLGQLPLGQGLIQALTTLVGVGLVMPLVYAFIFNLYKELA